MMILPEHISICGCHYVIANGRYGIYDNRGEMIGKGFLDQGESGIDEEKARKRIAEAVSNRVLGGGKA